MKHKRAWAVALVLLVTLLVAGCGGTAGNKEPQVKYPEKTITIVAHSVPGSGADLFARQVAKALEGILKQSVVVENKPGGSGAVAVSYVAKANPDGYTLLGVTNTMLVTPFVAKTPNTLADLEPIGRLVVDPDVIYVRADSPYKTAQDLFAALKEKPQKWGCPQVSSPEYIAAIELKEKYGLQIDPIPYAGGSEALTSVLNGDVVAGVCEPAEIAGQIKAGDVKVLATFTPTRLESFSDLPTVKELGCDVSFEKFRGLMAPKGTPPEAIKILADALQKVLDDPGFQSYYKDNSMQKGYLDAAGFAQVIEESRKGYEQYFATHPTSK
ncbi:MAG TPA: tripartite tricarboxylate transporter substrate binding protein [Firmicutes bacterium]|nr:tripartite tricarboxylate transporter substrate binding protein [Bacillota bacterium]